MYQSDIDLLRRIRSAERGQRRYDMAIMIVMAVPAVVMIAIVIAA